MLRYLLRPFLLVLDKDMQRESFGGIDGTKHGTEGGIYPSSHSMHMAAGFGFQSDLASGRGGSRLFMS